MNIITKYGSVLSCAFLLAACETPSGSEDAVYDGAAGVSEQPSYAGNSAMGMEEEFVTTVGDRVYFGTNSSVVTSEGRSTIERQSQWLNQHNDINVVVEGHADERGTREYNLALGERRANAAKNILIASGISPDRITVISYGKERPAVLGSNEQAWAQNRRSVTVLAK